MPQDDMGFIDFDLNYIYQKNNERSTWSWLVIKVNATRTETNARDAWVRHSVIGRQYAGVMGCTWIGSIFFVF